jgi:hypothetical protein
MKNSKNMNYYKNYSKSINPTFNNKVYIDSKMIKSVIKNYEKKRYDSPFISNKKKNNNTQHAYSCFDFTKNVGEIKNNSRERVK